MATIAELRGWAPVAAIQVEYNLLKRTVEGEQFGAARELGLGVATWSPLASGVLSGKYTRGNASPEGSGRAWHAARLMNEETFAVLDVLQAVSADLGSPMAAVALAWVRQQPEVTATIVGARTVAQLDANLASLQVTILERQLAELDEATRPRLEFPADLLRDVAPNYQQAGATVNGVTSAQFRR
jgi:aryl-alcohol dehydrogenase-like predicted oxidoreductase